MFYLFFFFLINLLNCFFLADDEEDKTEVSWLKLNTICFVFVTVVGFKSHTVCQNCVHRQVVYIESSLLLDP